MKTILGAIALIIAAPAAAQTATADPHAGHAQHQQQGQHQQHHGAPKGDHSQHKMDCCKPGGCCDKMKQTEARMDCCKDKAAAASARPTSR